MSSITGWTAGRYPCPWLLDRSRLIFIRPTAGDVTSAEVLASAAFWIGVWIAALVGCRGSG
jgi:hypothetical protein